MSETNPNAIYLITQSDLELAGTCPPQFLWGAATASYQIEGAIQEDGRGTSIWDTFSATPGRTYNGDTGAVAVDHYHRMQEDLEIIARLGLDGYRFSIAWPRVLPTGSGPVNNKGLDFYDRLVDRLLVMGVQPFATLYHWDLPQPLQDAGGWTNRETAQRFADYVVVVVRRLGDRVTNWMTLNEPWCSAFLGYGIGVHAPGIRDRQAAVDAGHHLLLAHGLAVTRIRAVAPATPRVGIVLNFAPAYPADNRPETLRDRARSDAFSNRWLLEPITLGAYPSELFTNMQLNPPPIQSGDMEIISTPIDFLGVNYYTRTVITGSPTPAAPEQAQTVIIPDATYTEMDWEVYPSALTDLLVRLHRDYGIKELIVTENGAAFVDQWDGSDHVHDPQRLSYFRQHVSALSKAIEQGVPLRGYFAWSLLDNYEWAEGYSKRFGLVYVDYPTQRRIIKDSGLWYQAFLAAYHQR
jgi:beta-glucosidase